MTPDERKKAEEILDDTMTVSQERKRKIELRDKDLKIRAASLERKKKKDAETKAKKAKAASDKEKSDKVSAQDKKNAAGTSAVISRKRKRDELEAKKLENLKGIASKRKEGVKKSTDRAKEVSKGIKSKSTITKDEGEFSAQLKFQKDAVKAGAAGARAGFNLAKAGAKALASAPSRVKAGRAQAKADEKERKIEKRNEKLAAAKDKKVKERLNRRRNSKLKKMNPFQKKKDMKEELILLEIERMEKKTDKVIDIMRGKNKIEISPKSVSEEVTGGVSIQDAADYTPLEIETVDIVTPKKLNHSDWRNDLDENKLTDLGFRAGRALKNMGGDLVKGTATSLKNLATGTPNTAQTNPASARQQQRLSNIGNYVKTGKIPTNNSSTTTASTPAAQTQIDKNSRARSTSKDYFGTNSGTSGTALKSNTSNSSSSSSSGPTGDSRTSSSSSSSSSSGGSQSVLAKKGGVEGRLDKSTGKFTPGAFSAAEKSRYSSTKSARSSSSRVPPARTTSTSTSKPAAPARDRMAGASKEDRMAAWAKANPKLAAAKAKRDASRGTSATSNPMLKDRKSKMPAPAVGAATAKANEQVEPQQGEDIQEYGFLVRQGIKGGRKVADKAKKGNKKKMIGDGKAERIGAMVGGVGGALAGGILDGPLPVGDIVGGIAGSKVGGKIGRQIDKFSVKKKTKKDEKESVKEEASDAMKDRRMERGGVGGNQRYDKSPGAPNTFGKKKPKKGGPSAMDIVKSQIRAKYGDKAIVDTKKKTKKEEFSDWKSEENIQEFIKFTDAAKRRAEYRKNSPTGGDYTKWKPGVDVPFVDNELKLEPFKAGSHKNPLTYKGQDVTKDMATDYAGKKLNQAGDAIKGAADSVVNYAKNNPAQAAAIGAGVVGAGLLANKVMGGDKKKKEKKESFSDWRSEMGIVEEEGKKDACYKKVKASAKVWPSAYASGRLVQCRKKGAANYGNSKKD